MGPSGETWGMVDMGDIATYPTDAEGNRSRIRDATDAILASGAAPVLLGGDDSVPIPWFSGFEGTESYVVLQIDAHADWGASFRTILGVMAARCAAPPNYPGSLAWCRSASEALGAARAWQNRRRPALGQQARHHARNSPYGIAAALNEIPKGANVLVSMDCDGMDPSVLPAVNMPTPGGLLYQDVVELLAGVAGKGPHRWPGYGRIGAGARP